MKGILKKFYLVLFLIISFFLVCSPVFGFFDKTVDNKKETIKIGNWEIAYKNIEDYLDDNEINLNDESINDVIKDILLEKDDDGNNVVKEQYDKYETDELIDIVEEIKDFSNNFLTPVINEETGKAEDLKYKSKEEIDFVEMDFKKLNPGEYDYITPFILTADHKNTYWDPITLEITMESDSDISDYSLRILYDNDFFTKLEYSYLLVDDKAYNNYPIQKSYLYNQLKDIVPTNIISSNIYQYQTQGYKLNKNTNEYEYFVYNHNYSSPEMSGNWVEMPLGTSMILQKAQYNGIQPFEILEEDQTGLYFFGKTSGNKIEFRVNFASKENNGNYVPFFPIALVLSRASNSTNNNSDIKINYRVVSGSEWDN